MANDHVGTAEVRDAAPAEGRVLMTLRDGVAELVFDRPEARNAMTWAMYEQLAAACDAISADASVRVALLRGAGGKAFVAGTDIAQFQSFKSGEDGIDYEGRIDAGIDQLSRLPVPTVALVDGWCVGGGLAIATACDFRIATPDAKFAVPIARTLGNCLSLTNVARLQAAFGAQRVRRLLMLAEAIGTDEALACGYLQAVAARDEVEAQARALCAQLAALAPVTQQVSKDALRRLAVHDLPDGADLVRRTYGSDDFREGVSAFVEKRPPRWSGH
jgi:enoyl-CoA hydratase/carnithine racemase